MDYKQFLGKQVVVVKYRKKGEIRHVGKLTDIAGFYICLQTKSSRDVWISKPKHGNGYIKEVEHETENI